MITVSIGGKEIVVKPKKVLVYVEKLDFIKSRRIKPWDLIQGFPPDLSEENYKILVGIAMKTVYSSSSSVSHEEELFFDRSEEGFMYDLWRCLPEVKAAKGNRRPETAIEGIERARKLWLAATQEEKSNLKLALYAVDESNNLKNSDGPSDPLSPPGQEKP